MDELVSGDISLIYIQKIKMNQNRDMMLGSVDEDWRILVFSDANSFRLLEIDTSFS